MKRCAVVVAVLITAVAVGCAEDELADLEVHANPGGPDEAFDLFTRFVGFQGLAVYGTDDVSDDAMLHVAQVLAQYLDNDEDGAADNGAVHEELWRHYASLVVFGKPDDADAFFDADLPADLAVQDLYADEIFLGSASFGPFDATLEEVLHLVTTWGYARVYPDVLGEHAGSLLADAMDEAIAAGHYDPLVHEPDMPYAHQVSEFHYWVLTSILGAQVDRGDEIGDEWSLHTPALVRDNAPGAYALLTDAAYAHPSVLPDGSYEAPPGSS